MGTHRRTSVEGNRIAHRVRPASWARFRRALLWGARSPEIHRDAREKAALVEFPQYGGRVIGKDIKGPLGGETLNFPPLQAPPPGCQLGFTDRRASAKQVAAYYAKQLAEQGWKVERHPVSPDPQSDEPGDFIYPHVDGTRGDLRYEVHYWPTGLQGSSKMSDFTAEALNRDGTGVQVLVYER